MLSLENTEQSKVRHSSALQNFSASVIFQREVWIFEGEIWCAELVWNKEALWIPFSFVTPILQDKLCRCPTQGWLALQRIRGWVSIPAQALRHNRNTAGLWKSSCQRHSNVKIPCKVPKCVQRNIQIKNHRTLLRHGEYVYKEDVVYIMNIP